MSVVPAVNSPREAAAKESTPTPRNPCPKCGKPLTDAAGLGWCPACGYCRSLEESQAPKGERETAGKRPSMGGLVELGEAVGGLPRWVWIMAIGFGGFFLFSLLPAWQLKSSFDRALWTTCQIGVGLILIMVAQLIAVVIIAPTDEKISFKDVIVPFRLWSLVCKRLPRTYLSAWLGSWGLSLIVSALIFVGGLDHWMKYLPGAKNIPNKDKAAQR